MLARLFVFVGGLLVLALTAALVAPYFIDWTNFRSDFEREASVVLGRPVTVQGEARARLLPFPSVTFSDVSVGGGADGQPAMTVETFSMDAELAPFMRGEFLIFDMRLVRPKGTIEIASDGSVDWTVRPSTPFDAGRISLEKVTITEGQITVRHAASGRTHRLTEINTQMSAKSLTGPWRVDGTLRLDGMRMGLSASTGKVENGAMRLRLEADPSIYPAVLEADGSVHLERGSAIYSGLFRLRPKSDVEAQEAALPAGGNASPGYRLDGTFTLDHERLAVDEFRFETGPLDNPYAAEGTGSVDLGREPRFAITLDGAQVRFDEAVAGEEEPGKLTFADRVAALEEALLDLPRPSIPGGIEVSLPAVLAGDTTIRDVRLSAEPAEGGWLVKSLAATLPGRATLEASGTLATDAELGFDGQMLLAIAQPSGFAAWLSKDVDEAIRRLPAAGFQARVSLTDGRQTFGDLELALGEATFRGEADSRQPDGARPATALKLSGGALDVDGLAAFASLFVSDDGASRFADHDLDLEVQAGPVSLAGLTAESVDTVVRLRDGLLEIDRLSIGNMAGAAISATGTIEDFSTAPNGDIDASIIAVDLAPLIEAAAVRFPENPLIRELRARAGANSGIFEETRIDVIATAAANDDDTTGVAVSAHGTTGGTAFNMTISGKGRADAFAEAELSLIADGSNDDAGRLLALYGLPVLPLEAAGSGETSLSLKGSLAGGLETGARIAGRDASADFSGTVRLDGEKMSAEGSIGLEAVDLEPWLMTVGAGLPGLGLGLPVSLQAGAVYADGLLVLDGLKGTVDQGAVAGDVTVALRDGKPHLTGRLTLDVLDLEPLAAMVLGEEALGSGGEAWSETPFHPTSTAPFSADLEIAAATLEAGTLATASEASLSLSLDGVGLRLSSVSAKLFGGKLEGLFELKNNGGTGLLTSQAKLSGADFASAVGEHGLGGSLDISTALTASGKSIGGLVAGLSGSGTAALSSLSIAGIDPRALPRIIARADAVGKDIDSEKTAAFAPQLATGGSFEAEPVDLAFTVAGGVLRVPPLELENPAASIETDLAINLGKGTISASGVIAYEPGDEALVGSEPVLRFSIDGALGVAEPNFDSQPLAQFLMQRALEIEQARVEAMQAVLLEKQRLRRENRYYAALRSERERAALEARRQQEEALRQAEEERLLREEKARADAARKAEEAKARAEDETREAEAARRQAEENIRREAEQADRRRAEEAVRLAAEEEARRARESTELPGVNLDPLSGHPDDSRPAQRSLKPSSITDFLRSLGQ